jgi:hypothetical protein
MNSADKKRMRQLYKQLTIAQARIMPNAAGGIGGISDSDSDGAGGDAYFLGCRQSALARRKRKQKLEMKEAAKLERDRQMRVVMAGKAAAARGNAQGGVVRRVQGQAQTMGQVPVPARVLTQTSAQGQLQGQRLNDDQNRAQIHGPAQTPAHAMGEIEGERAAGSREDPVRIDSVSEDQNEESAAATV